jgi:hypothetical protein
MDEQENGKGIVVTLSFDRSKGISIKEFCDLERIVTGRYGKGVMISIEDEEGHDVTLHYSMGRCCMLKRSQRLQIKRSHGDMSRFLDLVELLCPAETRGACDIVCPFNPCAEGCRLTRLRELIGPSMPIGLCACAEVAGQEILCRSKEDCEYRVPSVGTPEPFYCTAEAVALAIAEEKEGHKDESNS